MAIDHASSSLPTYPAWRYSHAIRRRRTKANPLMAGAAATASDLEAIARLGEARKKLKEEIAKVDRRPGAHRR